MKRMILAALGLVLTAALAGQAQAQETLERTPLAIGWDLDGEAADTNQVVESQALTDSAALTVTASPDTCRLVDITVTDADSSITAGTLSVTGTDCWGDALIATYTFAAGGSGVKTLTVDSATYPGVSGAYFRTVTVVETGALTGEGAGDVVIVGYSANAPTLYPMYGVRKFGPMGVRTVNPFDSTVSNLPITTSGVSTTTVTSVSSNDAFANVAVGDLLYLNLEGKEFVRKVTARASADSITVNEKIKIPTAGVGFRYKHFFVFADPLDGWIQLGAGERIGFLFDVDANANTGGVVSNVECRAPGPDQSGVVQIDTDTVASGSAGNATTWLDMESTPAFDACRIGAGFGTGDDTDTAAEDVNIFIGVRR